jgi:hypothetical protein
MTALSDVEIEAMGVMCHFDSITRNSPISHQLEVAECLLKDVIEEIVRLRMLNEKEKECPGPSPSVSTVDGTG